MKLQLDQKGWVTFPGDKVPKRARLTGKGFGTESIEVEILSVPVAGMNRANFRPKWFRERSDGEWEALYGGYK